jgi:RNA polymerase sigma-70 factor (ECF subfamily)
MTPTVTPETFARQYDEHVAGVLRTATAIVGDAAAAEDVTHEVFLDLWRRPQQFDPSRGELGGFLRMKARSRALDARRRMASAARLQDRCTHVAEVEPVVVHPDDPTTAPKVRAAVRALPPTQREAIALAYWGGLSCTEIAEHCGDPLGTAKSRMRLGLARLASDVALVPLRQAHGTAG